MNTINSLPDWFIIMFLFIGVSATVLVAAYVIIDIIENIKAKISVRVYAYKVKHRFDKPPLAKCYCRDCEYWQIRDRDSDNAKCRIVDRYTGDNWFCRDATPRKKDPDSQ